VDATLTGKKNTNLLGNNANNTFKGNAGNNIFDGGEGNDAVIFQGKREEYEINDNIVNDLIQGRDGTDTLISIEVLKFEQD
jgi:Ca2+-binding RTX toxin-like protein